MVRVSGYRSRGPGFDSWPYQIFSKVGGLEQGPFSLVRTIEELIVCMYVCMYKGWAIKLALAPQPLMIYCASPLAAAMIITVAALRIVLAHGSKPT
jgi:hypothetical protein